MKSKLEFIDDATFWSALPCHICRTDDVPFCLDSGAANVGACDDHVASVLKHLVIVEGREVLVILVIAPYRRWAERALKQA